MSDTSNTTPKKAKLRVLNLEDTPNDSELIKAELETEWDAVELLRVQNREAFVHALDEFNPDIVLSDFQLPGFDGRSALGIVRHTHPNIPVLMVTGVLADIEAVELVKMGAADYVTKDHLHRLCSSVQRALSLEQGIRTRKAIEKALLQSEADIRAIVEYSPVATIVDIGVDADEKIVMMNQRFTGLFGYTMQDIPDVRQWWLSAYPDAGYREKIKTEWMGRVEKAILSHSTIEPIETTITCKDGTNRYVRISFASTGSRNIITFEDMTGSKQAEARILRLNQLYATLSLCNQAIVRSKNQDELFMRMCRSIVQFGDFNMAWIGLVDPETHMVNPIAHFGEGSDEYLQDINISADADSAYGQGPTGTCLRENQPFWCQNFLHSSLTAPWHERAAALGWRSSAALPLHRDGVVIGAFMLFSGVLNAFDEDSRNLLIEMSQDIDYALDNLSHVAQREKAEQELAESRSLLKTVIDTAPMRIFWKDKELRYMGCNPAFAKDAGVASPEDMIGKDDFQFGWKDWAELYRADDRRIMESGIPKISYDEPQTTPDGKTIWLRTSKVPLRNAENEILGLLGIYEDITEHKLTELALQRSEADLNRAQAVAQVGSWHLDIVTNRLEWSAEAYRIFGIPQQESVDLDIFISAIHPDDRDRVVKAWNEAVAGAPYDIEHRVVVAGETRWVRERAIIERDTEGRPLFGVGTTQDITARRLAEDELRKLSLAVEQSPNSIVVTDLDAKLEYVNAAFVKATGYSREEAIGQNPRILQSGKTSRKIYNDMWAHLTRGESWKGAFINRRKDGSEFVEAISVSPVRDADGRITHYVGVKEDITQRRRIEKALQDSEEKFRAMSASAQDAIMMIDNDGNIAFWNHAAEKIFGYTVQEALNKNLHLLLAPERYHETSHAGFSNFQRSGKGSVLGKTLELVALHKSGKEFPIELSLSPVKIAGHWQAIGIMRDISQRKQIEVQLATQYEHVAGINAQLLEANQQLEQAQNQLLQSEKMAAIGVLAAGVAHEINNPVGYVNSNLGTLEKYLADIFVVLDKYEAVETLLAADNPLLQDVRQFKAETDLGYIRGDIKSLMAESHQGLERVKKIVLDLKEFSHADSEDQWGWADVHHGLDSTLNVVWNELKYKCEVAKEYAPLPQIYCLPSQLNQVFMNLLVNAAQAIEARGKITLRTGQEGERIWVEVSDTGKGIPPENMPRLFDPFFTTKPVGKGTGLGLSVSYRIVEKHHGKIEVRSELGKGTTFRVWLPVQQSDLKEKE